MINKTVLANFEVKAQLQNKPYLNEAVQIVKRGGGEAELLALITSMEDVIETVHQNINDVLNNKTNINNIVVEGAVKLIADIAKFEAREKGNNN